MAIVAFLPARGGSKSIPLKNIKLFCGKPLIYWNLIELESTTLIDSIVVATDNDLIEKTVLAFQLSKVQVFRRNEINASDTATTESVMLEFISGSNWIKADDTILLVQATMPLTSRKDFSAGIQQLISSQSDSLLSCVRTKRFFWQEDAKPINYDYKSRPRRQDFKGLLMENGAFYISRVESVIKHKCRISGIISIYEMPEYTALEIDEPDDWILAESLMKRHFLLTPIVNKSKNIKLLIADVDGVLTDAGMYYTEKGDEIKKFNTYDGVAFQSCREMGIKTAIITGENTKIVERRAKKMKIDFLFQGIDDKLTVAEQLCGKLGITLLEVAFIGDDNNDVKLLEKVGFPACPKNAQDRVKSIPNIIQLESIGGSGVVRELTEKLINY